MKRYISNLLAGVAIIATPALVACSKDYLETSPTDSVSAGMATSTAENGYNALNGIAKTMSTQQYAWSQGCAGEGRIYIF